MRGLRYRGEPNRLVLHVTNRTITGLPFVPKKFMEELIAGIMGKCQERFKVQLCHFLWMGNHYHMIVAGQAKQLSPFICQMQSEIAKMIMRLTPQYKGKVWARRFREQRLCTAIDVLEMITYLYVNPVKAKLVKHSREWTGLSSLKMYLADSYKISVKWTPSRCLNPLREYVNIRNEIIPLKKLHSLPFTKYELEIKPNIWKRCFEESKEWSDEYIYETLKEMIKEKEKEYENEKFIGIEKVKKQSINKCYECTKRSNTPFLRCKINELRVELIKRYKYFCRKCREAGKEWRRGNVLAPYSCGAFRPSLPILSRLSFCISS